MRRRHRRDKWCPRSAAKNRAPIGRLLSAPDDRPLALQAAASPFNLACLAVQSLLGAALGLALQRGIPAW
jgi:hypothetical protein